MAKVSFDIPVFEKQRKTVILYPIDLLTLKILRDFVSSIGVL